LAASLEQAGFAAGADAYRRMADVILGQRLWAEEHDITDFDARYAEVGRLATRIFEYLSPYTQVAARLGVLAGLSTATEAGNRTDGAKPEPDVGGNSQPDEAAGDTGSIHEDIDGDHLGDTAGAVLAVLREASRALPATRIGTEIGITTSSARQVLTELIAGGLVEAEKAGGRSLFRAVG
jgi:hypothetical protein